MHIVRDIPALRAAIAGFRAAGQAVALVPTMGALHAGHLSLLETARRHAPRVVASVFVNPTQFSATEDLDRYPRQEATDAALLAAAGCDLLFAPTAATVYPAGFATTVNVGGLDAPFEGEARPGHFAGVATVVAKLLLMAGPDTAVFGEKDWQQLAVIRRMVADLNLPVAIVGSPTVRDVDGLALSSRNAYLAPDQRRVAAALPTALFAAADRIMGGSAVPEALAAARQSLTDAGFDAIDYVALAHPETLALLDRLDRPARLLAAARIGTTRLLDNVPVAPQ
jgi:pantoate--beta-alanine ligase